jgi:hypothetical protein
MANDMIDRNAAGMGIAAIADIRRNRPGRDDRVMGNGVDRVGTDAGLHDVGKRIEHRSGDLPRLVHGGEVLGAVELDRAGTAIGAFGRRGNIVSHRISQISKRAPESGAVRGV